jgi:hypothetical protein
MKSAQVVWLALDFPGDFIKFLGDTVLSR